jgi:hypothetical protein
MNRLCDNYLAYSARFLAILAIAAALPATKQLLKKQAVFKAWVVFCTGITALFGRVRPAHINPCRFGKNLFFSYGYGNLSFSVPKEGFRPNPQILLDNERFWQSY